MRSQEKRQYREQKNGKPKEKAYPKASDALAVLDAIMAKKQGRRVSQWTYHDDQGSPIAVVARYDLPTPKGEKQEKTFRPVAQCGGGWIIGGMPEPRPLYGLPDLRGADRVFITEGEKAADAARAIGLTATTSAHGSKSPDKTDWSHLAGKECVILPDHGDITDWVEARPDADAGDLRRQVEALADDAEVIQPVRLAPRIEPVSPKASDVPDQKDSWPDPLAKEAFYGLAGEIVWTIEPHSEADIVAILIQVLLAFGNLIGRSAHFRAEADKHYGNLFTTLVGVTSKGRKGSS